MTNPSMKEQLQALSLGQSGGNPKPAHKSQKSAAPTKNPNKAKPAWLEQAQYGVELLKAYFPLCFKEIKDIQPLKIGIKQDLAKLLSTRDDIVLGDKACMVNSLSYYVNSPAYHKCMVENASRIDLEGNPVGTVTVEEAQYSMECRKAKFEKKQEKGTKSSKSKDSMPASSE